MKTSRYFADLGRAYAEEIDDLLTDTDGRTVLRQRLDVKRREIGALLPMIEFSPEMVAPAFYDAFRFNAPALMQQIAQSEPGARDFPRWSALAAQLVVADWAQPLVDAARAAEGGEAFLVVTATLEYLRVYARGAVSESAADEYSEYNEADEEGDDEAQDLAEAGADWLSEQGFESTSN